MKLKDSHIKKEYNCLIKRILLKKLGAAIQKYFFGLMNDILITTKPGYHPILKTSNDETFRTLSMTALSSKEQHLLIEIFPNYLQRQYACCRVTTN